MPPALALLEVAALPAISYGLCRGRAVAGVAAFAATLAGVVLGLAGSRLALGLAVALLVALAVRPQPWRHARLSTTATACFAVIGIFAGHAVLGGHVDPTTPGAGIGGLSELAALALAACALWLLVPRAGISVGRGWVMAGICVAAIALVAATFTSIGSHRQAPAATESHAARPSDLLHGRAHEWSAAIETWLDRPWLGAGADAYYFASLQHQTVARSRFAHNLPLELAAELGVLGLPLGAAMYVFAA